MQNLKVNRTRNETLIFGKLESNISNSAKSYLHLIGNNTPHWRAVWKKPIYQKQTSIFTEETSKVGAFEIEQRVWLAPMMRNGISEEI
jgi:hypothetical protein